MEIIIPTGSVEVRGDPTIPLQAFGLVVFAHGSGSSRFSPRNQFVAHHLQQAGFATLLMDLLTPQEEEADETTREFRFDIPRLAKRLGDAAEWLQGDKRTQGLPLGYFGSSTGAAAALVAAGEQRERVKAAVSRGGRPDLAGVHLLKVTAPTLLIVGGNDLVVLNLNAAALDRLQGEKKLQIIPEATHLFEEPGKLEEVVALSTAWFSKYLTT